MILREYQRDCVDAIWNNMFHSKSSLVVLPTGTGKTACLVGLIRKASTVRPDVRIVFLVNKINLLKQTKEVFQKHIGPVGIYCGSMKEKELSNNLTIASIQSIHKIADKFNIAIIDEVHRFNQFDGQYFNFINKISSVNEKLKVVGVTATPYSSSGYIYGDDKFFSSVCYSKTLDWAVENKFIVRPIFKYSQEKFDTDNLKVRMGEFAPEDIEKLTSNQEKMKSQIEDALPRLVGRNKIIWSCSSIDHAENLASMLKRFNESVVCIHSKISIEEQDKLRKDFEFGNIRNLTFVTLISEGVDMPCIDAVVLMRPTRSPVLYVQTVGRSLRPYKDKQNSLVLDYGSVVENCGPIEKPYVAIGRKQRTQEKDRFKFCPECLSYTDKKTLICVDCGHKFETKKRDSLKKLTISAWDGVVNNKVRVDGIRVTSVKSKKGNDCYLIRYVMNNPFVDDIREWVVKEQWSIYKFLKKVSVVGIKEIKDFDFPRSGVVAFTDKNEQGYTRITGFEPNTGLSKQDGDICFSS